MGWVTRSSVVFALIFSGQSVFSQTEISITELQAKNKSTLEDPECEGQYSDWIEITNPNHYPIDLNDYTLSDDPDSDHPLSGTIPANSRAIVFAIGNSPSCEPGINVPFKLSSDGETLYLKKNGTVIQTRHYHALQEDRSYGFDPINLLWGTLTEPTPGFDNLPVIRGLYASKERGYFSEPFLAFDLDMRVVVFNPGPDSDPPAIPGTEVRYTLDGSVPNANSTLFTNPINIGESRVVRARGFLQGKPTTDIITHGYIFLHSIFQQEEDIPGYPRPDMDTGASYEAELDYEVQPLNDAQLAMVKDSFQNKKTGLPIIIVSTSIAEAYGKFLHQGSGPPGWMDGDTDSDVEGEGVEVPASVQVIFPGGKSEVTHACQELHSHRRYNPSSKLKFKAKCGASKFETELFSRDTIHFNEGPKVVDRLILQNGNNRAITRAWNHDNSIGVINPLYGEIQVSMHQEGARSRPAHVFFNHVYGGITHVTLQPDGAFQASFDQTEGTDYDKDDYCVVNHNGKKGGQYGCDLYTTELVDLVRADNLSNPSQYTRISNFLDIDRFIDYVALSWWMGMCDWAEKGNNWYGNYRNPQSGSLGKFKFYAWDGEWSFDTTFPFNPTCDTANDTGAWVHPFMRDNYDVESNFPEKEIIRNLWHALRKNPDFMIRFADRIQKLTEPGGKLSDSKTLKMYDHLVNRVKNAMPLHYARWGDAMAAIENNNVTFSPVSFEVDWINTVQTTRALIDGNKNDLIDALQDEGYFPTIDAPRVEQPYLPDQVGGFFYVPININLVAPGSVIYYTVNGADPRNPDGTIHASAIQATGAIPLGFNGPSQDRIRARSYQSGNWSALTDAEYLFLPGTFNESLVGNNPENLVFLAGNPTAGERIIFGVERSTTQAAFSSSGLPLPQNGTPIFLGASGDTLAQGEFVDGVPIPIGDYFLGVNPYLLSGSWETNGSSYADFFEVDIPNEPGFHSFYLYFQAVVVNLHNPAANGDGILSNGIQVWIKP